MAEKILLVDDDLDTLRLVGLMLQRQGYVVRAASSGIQALSMIQKELPDLVLLDVMMPEMDGYEVARRLRAETQTSDIPIIMFTAKSQVDDKVMGFEAGADDYLTKPTQPRELFAHMKAVLSRAGKSRKAGTAPIHAERGHTIATFAAKGGLGVSTLALNLGIALHDELKKEVIVADFRPGQGTIGLELGLLKPEGLNHLLQRKPNEISPRDIESELIPHASGVRLLLASHHPKDAKYSNQGQHFEAITKILPTLVRFVVLDLPPSLTLSNSLVLNHVDSIILAVEPVPHTIDQTKAMIDNMVEMGIGEGRIDVVLINRTRSGVQLSWSQVQDRLERNISVIFTPAPELTYQASVNSVPLMIQQPDSLTAQQFRKLVEKVSQRSVV